MKFHLFKKPDLNVVVKRTKRGRIFDIEYCKGYLHKIDNTKAYAFVKRKHLPNQKTLTFNYNILSNNTLEVMESKDHLIPISKESYENLTDSLTNRKHILRDLQSDISKHKAWKTYAEKIGKETFFVEPPKSLMNYVMFGIIIVASFLGYTIIWVRAH